MKNVKLNTWTKVATEYYNNGRAYEAWVKIDKTTVNGCKPSYEIESYASSELAENRHHYYIDFESYREAMAYINEDWFIRELKEDMYVMSLDEASGYEYMDNPANAEEIKEQEEQEPAKTYKQLVTMLAEVKTYDDGCKASSEIDKSFNEDAITPDDYGTLYAILRAITRGLEEEEPIEEEQPNPFTIPCSLLPYDFNGITQQEEPTEKKEEVKKDAKGIYKAKVLMQYSPGKNGSYWHTIKNLDTWKTPSFDCEEDAEESARKYCVEGKAYYPDNEFTKIRIFKGKEIVKEINL